MTTRVEGLRSQARDVFKQAVGQVETVSGVLARSVVERLDLDVDQLRNRRDAMLRNLGKQSARLAEQDIPMPNVVRSTLGLVNHLLDGLVDQPEAAPARAAANEAVQAPVTQAAKPASKTNRREGGTSRPRKPSNKSGARKPRRPSTAN